MNIGRPPLTAPDGYQADTTWRGDDAERLERKASRWSMVVVQLDNLHAEWEADGDERGCSELRSCIGMVRDRITGCVTQARALRIADKEGHD